jgi:hypothetical protein
MQTHYSDVSSISAAEYASFTRADTIEVDIKLYREVCEAKSDGLKMFHANNARAQRMNTD